MHVTKLGILAAPKAHVNGQVLEIFTQIKTYSPCYT